MLTRTLPDNNRAQWTIARFAAAAFYPAMSGWRGNRHWRPEGRHTVRGIGCNFEQTVFAGFPPDGNQAADDDAGIEKISQV